MDRRLILLKRLKSLELDKINSEIIALDVGASQMIINKENLRNCLIPVNLIDRVLEVVIKFYMGELN